MTPSGQPSPPSAHAPGALRVAAGWSWRILVVVAAAALVVIAFQALSVVVVPLAVAVLLAALMLPFVRALHERLRFPVALAAFVAILLLMAAVGGLLTFAGTAIASGMTDLLDQARSGLNSVINWLHTGPLHLSDKEINSYLSAAEDAVTSSGGWLATSISWATSLGHVLAGILITLFATYFFLAQGQSIAVFVIALLPRAAQEPTYQAGRRGWASVTSYVRTQVVVAAIDAIGIAIGALILRLPLVFPLGVLVFLTAFIPIVGAIAAGAVAVLIALVTHGLTVAVIMLVVVIGVQEIEAHLLQPFLMGHAVNLHPLAVLIAVMVGGTALGIVGALFAVPAMAFANSAVRYYYGYDPLPGLGSEPMPPEFRPSRPSGSA
jgi:predicted PurR-regulated permease PerM